MRAYSLSRYFGLSGLSPHYVSMFASLHCGNVMSSAGTLRAAHPALPRGVGDVYRSSGPRPVLLRNEARAPSFPCSPLLAGERADSVLT